MDPIPSWAGKNRKRLLGVTTFMSPLAPTPLIERVRPLLGTQVSIGLGGLPPEAAHRAIDSAFAVVEAVHRQMSFHEAASDISRLNREAADRPVGVAAQTFRVIAQARDISRVSEGVFDLSIAPHLVAWGFLPRPGGAPEPQPEASWRDVELLPDNHIRFHRRLWIDVGGIAKGYAVDRAIEVLQEAGAVRARVNAGGDVRVFGTAVDRIALRTDISLSKRDVPVIDLTDGSIASSSGRAVRMHLGGADVGPHLDGRVQRAVGTQTFTAVLAQECVIADALTKVVLALEDLAAPVLDHFGALAYMQNADGDWRSIGTP